MSVYTKAGSDVYELLSSLIVGYHGDLDECEVKVGVMFAHPGAKTPEKPALTENGHPVRAKVTVTNLKDRVSGMPDVRIEVDGPFWADADTTEEIKLELLDSQLQRLEVKRDKESHIVTDDHGRPVLRRKKYDYVVAGFDSIIRRHGRDSLAVRAINDLSLHSSTLIPPGGGPDMVSARHAADADE